MFQDMSMHFILYDEMQIQVRTDTDWLAMYVMWQLITQIPSSDHFIVL